MDHIIEFRLGPYRGVIFAFLLSLIIAEIVWSWRKGLKNYNAKETAANFGILAGLQLSKFIFAGYQLTVLSLFYSVSLFHIENNWISFIIAFFFVDFLYYWYHYLSHKFNFLWAFHLVHHSSPWMNLTTSYRLNWIGSLIFPFFFFPAIVIGFSPSIVALCAAFNLLYQFFLHTEFVPKLGFLEKIVNTPSHHRVHHGSNTEYLDKNFGGVLIVWDRIFGTYQTEAAKPVYGITTGFAGHNPVKLVFQGFVDLFQGKLKSKG